MLWFHRNKKSVFTFTLIILFCVPSVLSLFQPGFFQSDDGEWMVIRFSAFHQELRDGQFPVRYLSRLNFGYGYPVANFLYPGFMYLSLPIHLLGFGFVDSIKAILMASMIGSAIFCYLWLSKFFDKLSSFVGALFYLYTPYHLFDLYKRGSVGEVLSLAVLPFLLWQIERRSFFWTSLGVAFLTLSHNTLALLFLGLIFVYISLDIYISKNKKDLLQKYLTILIFGFSVSSFFWIPAFFELPYTVFSQTQVSSWNTYFASIGLIGISTIFVLILTAFFFVASKIQIRNHRLTVLLFVVSLISVFFASSPSAPLWNILPVSFIQFPFRFLSLTIVAISFLSACIVSVSPNKLKIPIIVLSLIILMLSAKQFLTPSEFFDKGDIYYATNEATTTVKNEYMPKWVKNNPKEHYKNKVEIANGKISDLKVRSNNINFVSSSTRDTEITINTIFFPGWKVFVDGNNSSINYNNKSGVIKFNLSSGTHKVTTNFSETPVRFVSNIVSLASFLVLLIIVVNRSRGMKV